jgi:hypothetical protein
MSLANQFPQCTHQDSMLEPPPACRNPPVPPPVRISPRPLRSGASWTVEGDISQVANGTPLSSGAKPKLKSPLTLEPLDAGSFSGERTTDESVGFIGGVNSAIPADGYPPASYGRRIPSPGAPGRGFVGCECRAGTVVLVFQERPKARRIFIPACLRAYVPWCRIFSFMPILCAVPVESQIDSRALPRSLR